MTRVSSPASTSLADASTTPYWLDDPHRPAPLPRLEHPTEADLVVVGGGYLGLWTALLAKERDPGRDVVLLEGATCGHAASGRNGGFCEASLTHGFGNGRARWPDELREVIALGHDNLNGIRATIDRHGIDCDFVKAGSLAVATQPHQVDPLREEYAAMCGARARPGVARPGRASPAARLAEVPCRRPRPRRARSSSRPDSLGGCAPRASRSGYGSTSTPR